MVKCVMKKYDFTRQPSILIQGAMETETAYLISRLADASCVNVGNWTFYTGFLGSQNEPVIISRTYQGEVNASAATVLGITSFAPKAVINQGIAGGHDKKLHVGDLVIGERVVPMGAVMQKFLAEGEGISPLAFEPLALEIYDKKEKCTKKVLDFLCDEELVARACRVKTPLKVSRGVLGSADEWNNQIDWIAVMRERYQTAAEDMESAAAAQLCRTPLKVSRGVLGSADEWNNQIDWIAVMRERYQTAAEDMESAAAAQLCRSFGIPFIGIRMISNSIVNGEAFDESMALAGQKFIEAYIEELCGF